MIIIYCRANKNLAFQAKKEKTMDKVKNGDWVFVHYTGKFEDGKVFDTSLDGEPLDFVTGEGNLVEGFEKAVIGMAKGEKKTVKLTPAEGYGEYDKEAVFDPFDADRIAELLGKLICDKSL